MPCLENPWMTSEKQCQMAEVDGHTSLTVLQGSYETWDLGDGGGWEEQGKMWGHLNDSAAKEPIDDR